MVHPQIGIVESALKRRAEFITFLARSISVGVASIALFLLWDAPTTKRIPALIVGIAYLAFAGASWIWVRRRPEWRRVARVLHDVADALAVGFGAALSGGLESPIWLLLYPHVVAVSVRGGLGYAMTLGTLDALLVYWLALLSPSHPLGELNAPAILFCAFMGGSTSSFLHRIRARLGEANRALQAKNEQLASTVGQVREANGRLEELHRLRDEYLRNVSHEFRSPLTVIRGYAEFVRDQGVPPDSSLPDVMRVMLDSCDQMIDMVDTLLEVSRIEQGETGRRLDIRTVALDEILESALASVRGLAEKKDARIDISLPGEPLQIAGDPSLLAHALRHLLSNALKYGPARGTVSIRGQARDGVTVLEVEDQGIGIPPEHLPHIFEKFYVADGGLDRRRGGAGVGLYLAREIVLLHQGTIEARSHPGRGSVFCVTLPRPKPSPPRGHGLRQSAPWMAALGLAMATSAGATDVAPDAPNALLDRLEQAWTSRDLSGYLALWVFPDAESREAEVEFTRDRFAAEELRLTVERPARFPSSSARVHAQVFSSTEPRARVEQFRFDISGDASGFWITGRHGEGLIDGLVHVDLDPSGFRADGLTLRLTDFELRMQRGTLFLSPASLGPTALLFVGEGQIRISPGPAAERDQLRIFCDRPELDERVRTVFVRIHPADLHRVLQPVRLDPDPGAASRWPEAQAFFKEQSPRAFVLDAPLPKAPWWLMPAVGDALVSFRIGRGTLTYALNSGDPEDVSLFNRDKRLQILLYGSGGREADWNENDARTVDILAHDLDVHFEPERFAVRGEDSMTLNLLQASSSLRLRLDDAMRVLSVTSPEGGNHIFFRVRGQNSIVVSLGPYSGQTGEARLVVRFTGILDPAPVEDEAIQAPVDERRGLADDDLFIERVLLYTNKNAWYPRNLSDDHARYRARFDVPAGYTVVAGGRLARSGTTGARATSEYLLDEPGKYLTAIVGRLVTAGKPHVGPPTLTAWSTRRLRSDATATLATAQQVVEFYTQEFGPCPYSFINLVLTENLTPGGHSPPGMVLVQRRPVLAQHPLRDDPANFSDVPGFFLAHELAHQWWGQGVAPKNYRERWLSEGAAQYAAALWVRKSRGEPAFRAMLKRFADWTFRNAEAGPIDLSYRVGHLRSDPQAYRAIVYDKGAYVLHMLRGLVGDEAFRHALISFQAGHRYQKAGTEEFRDALEATSGKDLRPYFREWVRGISVPELRITYRTEPAGNAFRTTVRVAATGLPGPVPLLVSLLGQSGRAEHQVVLGPEGGVFTLESADRIERVEVNADRALLARVKEG